jgi:hypothetical protein
MSDPDVKTHPEYEGSHATYAGALQDAAAKNDDVLKGRAELDWERAQFRMERELVAQNAATSARLAAVEKVKADFPDLDESIFEGIEDPARIAAMAEAINKVAEERAKKQLSTWGPPPGQSPRAPRRVLPPNEDPEYQRNLRERVNANAPGAVKEFVNQELNKKLAIGRNR